MWDKEVAIDLRAKAEAYLLEHKPAYLLEHKPEGFERSARAAEERNQLRLEIARAYYWQDVARHKKAVDELVLSTLKEYANWRGEHQRKGARTSG